MVRRCEVVSNINSTLRTSKRRRALAEGCNTHKTIRITLCAQVPHKAREKTNGTDMVCLPVSRDTGWERLEAIAHRLGQNSVKFLKSACLRNRLEVSMPPSADVHAIMLPGLEEEGVGW